MNKTGQELLQKSRVSLIGQSCNAIFNCDTALGHCRVIDSEQIDKQETHCPDDLKNSRTFLRSAISTHTENGRVIIEAFVDISEIKQADRAKNDFLAKMSHELRTPLNAIAGFTELLRDELPNDGAGPSHDYLDIMKSASRDLEHIIDELMDIARIRGNKIHLDMHDINVAELVRQMEQEIQHSSEYGELLRVTIDSNVDTVYTDPHRLKQMLSQLLANAFKYGNNSQVQLRIEIAKQNVEFVVIDKGHGMAKEQLQRVFNEFEQGDNSITRQFGGLGLGLSIAYHFAKLMGGELSIQSQLQEGTQVRLSLPIREV